MGADSAPEICAADEARLPADATLADAVERVRRGAPLILLEDPEGRLVATVEALAVRIAFVAGDALDSGVAQLAQPEARAESVASAAGRGPIVRARPVLDERGRATGVCVERAADPVRRAVVMAGGLGKRLRPLTEDVPKPLLEVSGSALLERMLLHLEAHGVEESVVSVNYLAESVERFVEAGGRWRHGVGCVREGAALGTAGVLGLLGSEYRAGPFFLVNGDIVTTADLGALAGHHVATGAAVTVATVAYEWRIPYGVVEPEGRRLAAVREKPLYRFETNAGLYAFDPRVLREIPAGDPCDMVELVNGLAERGEVVARFPLVEDWSDVGSPDDFERVQSEVGPLPSAAPKRA